MSEFQQVASVDLSQLSKGGGHKDLQNALNAERNSPLANAKSELRPAIGSGLELSEDKAVELLGKLLGPQMGGSVAEYVRQAGVESASIKPAAGGFDIQINLTNGVTLDSSQLGDAELPFDKVEIGKSVGMKLAIDPASNTMTLQPLEGNSDMGIGLGKDLLVTDVFSYATKLTLSPTDIHYQGTMSQDTKVPLPGGVNAAADGMLAFADTIRS